ERRRSTVNDHDKSQDSAQQSEYAQELAELLNLLETVDRQLTPDHIAARFRELLDGIGGGKSPAPPLPGEGPGCSRRTMVPLPGGSVLGGPWSAVGAPSSSCVASLSIVLRDATQARADARRHVEGARRCAEEIQDAALGKAARIEAEAREKA